MGSSVSFPVVALPRDRVELVTGGNAGIGYETAKWAAMMGATVIIACRSEERARQAISKMNSEYEAQKDRWKDIPDNDIPVHDTLAVEYMPLDLASLQSVMEFADLFKSSGRQLHVLLCNAGIAMTPFVKTADGYEQMLQVNYISHFLLTAKLLPIMRGSGPDCRLLFVSSDAHRTCTFDLTTMNYDGPPSRFGRLDYYGRSKLYQIMQMCSMNRRLAGSNVAVNAIHPGMVDTEISRNFKDVMWAGVLFRVSRLFGQVKNPLEGATPSIHAAVNPALAGVGGRYYKDCKDGYRTTTSKYETIGYSKRTKQLYHRQYNFGRNTAKQEALWEHTLDLLKERITDEERRCLEGQDIVPGQDTP